MTFLEATDYVGISFWIVSVAMFAATVFFLYEGCDFLARLLIKAILFSSRRLLFSSPSTCPCQASSTRRSSW